MQLFDPRTEKLVDVVDITEEVAKVTAANPVPGDVAEKFREHRPIRLGSTARLFNAFRALLAKPFEPPPSVAAGVLFNKATQKNGFDTEASIYWYVVAPAALGGSSDDLVYLTSSNLAAVGTEALIKYVQRGAPVFHVVESDFTFVVSIPASDPIFKNHLITLSINGTDHQTLYIANKTTGSGTSFMNEVFLFNPGTGNFDLVWTRSFTTSFGKLTREWGPIIEVPDGGYFGTTNVVGYADAHLVTVKGGVRHDVRLDPSNTDYGTTPRWQFEVHHLEPNYTMVAD